MKNNYFVSGMPKSGKTTLLRQLVQEMKAQGLNVGGFISPEEKVHGTRTGFQVEDIETGQKEMLASVDMDGPKVAKYHVDVKAFESFLAKCLKNTDRYDVVVIDEIGRMEMKSTKFQNCIGKLLESQTPLIASLHRDYVDDYRIWGEIYELTPSSRGTVYLDLLRRCREYAIRPIAAKKTIGTRKKIIKKASIAKKKKSIMKKLKKPANKKTAKKVIVKKNAVKKKPKAPKKSSKKKILKKKSVSKRKTKKKSSR